MMRCREYQTTGYEEVRKEGWGSSWTCGPIKGIDGNMI